MRTSFSRDAIADRAGIGLRLPHVDEIMATSPDLGWIEVHAENYMAAGGPRVRHLEMIRRDWPVSLHGVGLSLGSADGIDPGHLARLADAVARFEPVLVSEHVAWSVDEGVYLNDLLPIPYSEEALDVVCANVSLVQDRLGRAILMENPSCYLAFADSIIPEHEFLAEMARRTGCGLLVDVNNVYVNANNLGIDPYAWLDGIPPEAVGEIHVAGHWREISGDGVLLIDDHGSTVAEPVWRLLDAALQRCGPRPVMVEWDTRIPPLAVLLGEAAKAQTRIANVRQRELADVQ